MHFGRYAQLHKFLWIVSENNNAENVSNTIKPSDFVQIWVWIQVNKKPHMLLATFISKIKKSVFLNPVSLQAQVDQVSVPKWNAFLS